MNKLDMESKDIIDSNIEKLKELFPSCVQEDKIDFDMLKQELSSEQLRKNIDSLISLSNL